MKEIKATDGNWLTQQTITDEITRTFAKKVFTPNESLWTEWTGAQKKAWEDAHPVEEPNDEGVVNTDNEDVSIDEINEYLNTL